MSKVSCINTTANLDKRDVKAFKADIKSGAKPEDVVEMLISDAIAEHESLLEVIRSKGGVVEDYVAPVEEVTPVEAIKPEEVAPKEEKTTAPVDKPLKQNQDKLQDFGDVLEGAAKHSYGLLSKSLETEIDVKAVPLSKSFPLPNYEKMIADGVAPDVAAAIAMLRGRIKPKQRKRISGVWIESVNEARAKTKALLSGILKPEDVFKKTPVDGNHEITQLAKEILPAQVKELGRFNLERQHFSLYGGEKDVNKWAVADNADKSGARSLGANNFFDTKEEALAHIKSKVADVNQKTGKAQTKFDIWSERGKEGVFLGKKINARKYVELGVFASATEAREYRDNNYDELVERLKSKKATRPTRRVDNNPRVGDDYREGVDVTPDLFTDTFGFRGVQFGNWVEGGKRQEDLNNAYDGLMDLAAIIDVPPKALSLNGSLGLAFGARGRGGKNPAAAHFEPGGLNINLTKMNGSGSLAHEVFHAIDNYFGTMDSAQDYISEYQRPSRKKDTKGGRTKYRDAVDADFNVRREVYDAWQNLVTTIKKETDMVARSASLDSTRNKDYWSTVREMTARSFERYVIGKLDEGGHSSDYLANIVSEKDHNKVNEVLGDDEAYAYPLDSEMDAVNRAYDNLFDTLETKETNSGIALHEGAGLYSGYERDSSTIQDGQNTAGISEDKTANTGREQQFDLFTPPKTDKTKAYADLFGTIIKARPVSTIRTAVDTIAGDGDLAHLMASIRKDAQESFYTIATSASGKVLRVMKYTRGTKNASSVHPLDVVAEAASIDGAAVLHFAHNHPSGNSKPSGDDVRITEVITKMMDGTGLSAGSHVVIGESEWNEVNDIGAPKKIKPGIRNKSVDMTERRIFKRDALGEAVENPSGARELVAGQDSSIFLLNQKHAPVAIIQMSGEEMAELRSGGRVNRILSAINKSNAAAAIVKTKEKEDANNVTRFLSSFNDDIRVLDAFVEEGGATISLAEKGAVETTGPFYSRDYKTSPATSTVAEINTKLSTAISRLDKTIQQRVKIVQTVAELPVDVPSDVRGMHYNGIAYVVADNTPVSDAKSVLTHEVVGHMGLESMLGDSYHDVIGKIKRMKRVGNKQVAGIIKTLEKNYVDNDGNYALSANQEAREILAHIAETDQNHSLVKQLIAKLKLWLARVGLANKDNAEIGQLIAQAARYVEGKQENLAIDGNGKLIAAKYNGQYASKDTEDKDDERSQDQRFSRQTDSKKQQEDYAALIAEAEAYGARVESSGTLDGYRNGEEVTVLHRSHSAFDEFGDDQLGGNTGTTTGFLGHFLAFEDAGNDKYGAHLSAHKIKAGKVLSLSASEFSGLGDLSEQESTAMRNTLMSAGYDGIAVDGLGWVIVFESKNITKVADDTGASYSRGNVGGNTSEENAYTKGFKSLGGKDKTVFDRAKKAMKREFTPGGLLPKSVFDEQVKRDSQLNVFEFDIANRLGHLDQGVLEGFNKKYTDLSEEDKGKINEALGGSEPDMSLPEAVREEIYKMRLVIKNLSKDYAAHLEGEIKDLQAQGNDAAAESKAQLLQTIIDNMDTYVHRSYRAFDDPKWPRKVPQDVYDNAAKYLERQYADGGAVTPEIQDKVSKTLELMLEEGTAFDSMEAFVKESKLGAKDLSVLQRRKQIAPEIRALLGEYTDPKVNFTKSVTKMSRLVMNQKFLDRVKELGVAEGFLFEKDKRPLDATRMIAADASESYAPLNGLYTYPEIDQAFKDALGKEQMADWFRTIVRLNGMVKYGKTVLSPTTAARNWMSAAFFAMANGHFNFSHAKKSTESIREYFSHGEGKDGYLKKLKSLGVIYDTPYAGEMMDLLADSQLEHTLYDKKPLSSFRKMNEFAQKFYQYGDDFWKIIGFENEKALLIKHKNMSEADAEVEAAERIRNTYPTYSMTGRFVQKLRRFPLAGTFVSFPSEIIRTSYHIIRYLKQDLKDSPEMGRRKVAGLAIASGMIHALQAASMSMMGMDDDEEESFRSLAAPWQENSNLLILGRDKDQNLRILDMSFLDPYNYWKRPINALMRDQPIDDALKDSAKEMLGPFFGQDIAFGSIMEAVNNKKQSGGRVFNPGAPVLDQTTAIANHLRRSLQPGAFSNAERIIKASAGQISPSGKQYRMEEEMAALVGFRATTFDPKKSIFYKSYGFKDKKRDATGILSAVARNPNKVSDADLSKAYRVAEETRMEAYEEMIKLVRAAMNAGVSRQEIIAAMKNSGVSKKDSMALASGIVPRWKPSDAMMRNAVRKAAVLFDDDIAEEFNRRRNLIRQQFREGAQR